MGKVVFSSHIPPPSLTRLLHISCNACKTNHCRGCIKAVSCPPNCRGTEKTAACTIDACCAEIRVIALFEALGGFDRQYIGERIVSNSRAKDIASKKKANTRSVGPGGTGYGADKPYSGYHPDMDHVGRGRGRNRGNLANTTLGKEREALAAHWEEVVTRALRTVTTYLPAPYCDNPQVYDLLPHASLGPLIALSQLPDLLGDLLRNDSVTDWAERGETYRAMLALLRRMGDCEVTIRVLVQQHWERRDRSDGIEEWMWGDADIEWERELQDHGGPGRIVRGPRLYECFKKLTRQCDAFLSGAAELLDEGQDGDEEHDTTVKTAALCGDIIAARDDIDRAMAVLGKTSADVGKGKGKAEDPTARMEEVYAQLCDELAFKHVGLSADDSRGCLSYPSFNYQGDVNKSANSTRKPKDRLRLIKELSTMSTSLPPGVWVRVDEVRNDIMHVQD